MQKFLYNHHFERMEESEQGELVLFKDVVKFLNGTYVTRYHVSSYENMREDHDGDYVMLEDVEHLVF